MTAAVVERGVNIEPAKSPVRERPILFSAPMVRAILDGRKTQTRRVIKDVPSWEHYGRDIMDWDLSGIHQETYDPNNPIEGTDRWHLDVQTDVDDHSRRVIRCPYGAPGDRLWVREAWSFIGDQGVFDLDQARPYNCAPIYRADGAKADRWWPSIHMPRWASRISLRITDVRVERLNDCSETDAIAEGLYRSTPDDEDRAWFRAYHEEQTGEPPTQADLEQFEEGVWRAPGVPQGWGLTPAERRQDQWGPTAQFAYRLLWDHINGKPKPGQPDVSWAANPWVWVVAFERVTP